METSDKASISIPPETQQQFQQLVKDIGRGGAIVDIEGNIIGHSEDPNKPPNPAWFPGGSRTIPLS
jgi:hypothetical protein